MKRGRIIEEHKTRYSISFEGEVFSAVVRGIFHRDKSAQDRVYPKVGDFVEYTMIGESDAVIENLLPRRTEVMRAVPARNPDEASVTSEVIVSNVDMIFIVVGLDNNFNISRIERYVLLASQSRISAVILLNKSDEVPDSDEYIQKVKHVLSHIPVHAISATSGTNMEVIKSYIKADTTAVLLGSSGAGKSTITNWLIGEQKQTIGEVRQKDSRGKHTTTSRQLFTIPTGGFLIDTPGMRELGVMSTQENEAETFTDIDLLKQECKFNKCDHQKTDGCAILEAIAHGEMDQKHLDNYLKIQGEREYSENRVNTTTNRGYKNKKRKLDT